MTNRSVSSGFGVSSFLLDASAGSNCFVRTRAAMRRGGLESMGLKTIADQLTFYGSINVVFHEFI